MAMANGVRGRGLKVVVVVIVVQKLATNGVCTHRPRDVCFELKGERRGKGLKIEKSSGGGFIWLTPTKI